MKRGGFTLLEMLVASAIMGIAVVGLLSNISTSLRNASRVSEYDRVALVAKRQMDLLLLERRLPYDTAISGKFDPERTGVAGGWQARLTRFEMPPQPGPGVPVLERLELEVWWMSGPRRRTFTLEGFRRGMILAAPGRAGEGGP